MVTINTYSIIGKLDVNNMTKILSQKNENNEILIKIEQQLST